MERGAKEYMFVRRSVLQERTILIRAAIACSALVLSGLVAEAHQAVTPHHAHAAESRKPHATESRKPHPAGSHPKPQKPPRRATAVHDKPKKATKH
jgi:hypothetical protein